MPDAIFKCRAIYSLRPGANFLYRDDVLEWNDDESLRPTDDEILEKAIELEAQEPYKRLREKRNELLVETDWTQSRDVTLLNDAEWTAYRQALRDLPANTTDPANPTWPTKPS